MRIARSVLFWMHLAIGVCAGLIIFTMSVTGVLLAFERQIKAAADASVAFVNEPVSTPATPEAILMALEGSGRGAPSDLIFHSDPKAAVEARFGREHSLYLNPSTCQVIGEPSVRTRTFFTNVERIHRSLGFGMQSAFGRGLTGAANLVFLFMVVSGVYLWLPKVFSRTALRNRFWFRPHLHGRARDWNWHSVIGIWTAIPLLFIVLTGMIMSYPWANNLLYTLTGTQPPPPAPPRGIRPPSSSDHHRSSGEDRKSAGDFQSLQSLLFTAELQAPGWRTATLTVPQPSDRVMNLSFDKSSGGHPEQLIQIALNRKTGQIESLRPFSAQNTGRKLRIWARFLHTGEEFGVLGETIAAIASAGAAILVITGFTMSMRRLQKRLLRTKAT